MVRCLQAEIWLAPTAHDLGEVLSAENMKMAEYLLRFHFAWLAITNELFPTLMDFPVPEWRKKHDTHPPVPTTTITRALMLRSLLGKVTLRNLPAGIPSDTMDACGKEVSLVSRPDAEDELAGDGLTTLRPEDTFSILANGNLGLLSLLVADNDTESSSSSAPVPCELQEAIE